MNADPRFDTGDSNAPVPFYVSSRGYGILVDTARYATFYCGESRDKPTIAVGAASGGTLPMSTEGLYSRDPSVDQPAQVLVDVPGAHGVDVYLFAGPTMLDAVERYNLFSGGGVNPPEWGLGFWYRAWANAEKIPIWPPSPRSSATAGKYFMRRSRTRTWLADPRLFLHLCLEQGTLPRPSRFRQATQPPQL